jgi:hypothetical protein
MDAEQEAIGGVNIAAKSICSYRSEDFDGIEMDFRTVDVAPVTAGR